MGANTKQLYNHPPSGTPAGMATPRIPPSIANATHEELQVSKLAGAVHLPHFHLASLAP